MISYTITGIDTSGKDKTLLMQLLNCMGLRVTEQDLRMTAEDDPEDNDTPPFERFRYDLHFGSSAVEGFDADDEAFYTEKLFAVLNRLLGSTNVCMTTVSLGRGAESVLTEYGGEDMKKYVKIRTRDGVTETEEDISPERLRITSAIKETMLERAVKHGYTELSALILDKLRDDA